MNTTVTAATALFAALLPIVVSAQNPQLTSVPAAQLVAAAIQAADQGAIGYGFRNAPGPRYIDTDRAATLLSRALATPVAAADIRAQLPRGARHASGSVVGCSPPPGGCAIPEDGVQLTVDSVSTGPTGTFVLVAWQVVPRRGTGAIQFRLLFERRADRWALRSKSVARQT